MIKNSSQSNSFPFIKGWDTATAEQSLEDKLICWYENKRGRTGRHGELWGWYHAGFGYIKRLLACLQSFSAAAAMSYLDCAFWRCVKPTTNKVLLNNQRQKHWNDPQNWHGRYSTDASAMTFLTTREPIGSDNGCSDNGCSKQVAKLQTKAQRQLHCRCGASLTNTVSFQRLGKETLEAGKTLPVNSCSLLFPKRMWTLSTLFPKEWTTFLSWYVLFFFLHLDSPTFISKRHMIKNTSLQSTMVISNV